MVQPSPEPASGLTASGLQGSLPPEGLTQVSGAGDTTDVYLSGLGLPRASCSGPTIGPEEFMESPPTSNRRGSVRGSGMPNPQVKLEIGSNLNHQDVDGDLRYKLLKRAWKREKKGTFGKQDIYFLNWFLLGDCGCFKGENQWQKQEAKKRFQKVWNCVRDQETA